MERKLQCVKGEVDSAKNEAHLLKVHVDKAFAELRKSIKEQCKSLALESRLREGVASLQMTARFKQLLKDKIEAHMK
ncbi:hypothetical protein U1Q18_047028, partial [Sarracenia purpurea var. burkii]